MSDKDVQEAIRRIRELPTLPSILLRIIETVNDPDSSALDLGQHIAADQSLSATILRVVNSAYYGFYRQVNSVTTAIVILGFHEVRNLALMAKAFQAFADSNSRYDRRQLWRHSLATAMAAERIARLRRLNADGGHFIAGLLHDLGKVVLDTLYPVEYALVVRRAHNEKTPVLDQEIRAFNLDHTQAGAMLAGHWNLPTPVAEAMARHHHPDSAQVAQELVHVTALANYLTYQAHLGEASAGVPPPVPASSVAALAMSAEHMAQVTGDVLHARDRIDELLGAVFD